MHLASTFELLSYHNVFKSVYCLRLHIHLIAKHLTVWVKYRRAPFFRGLQISRISRIFGTSTKFVSPKINGNSFVTRMCINLDIVEWRC